MKVMVNRLLSLGTKQRPWETKTCPGRLAVFFTFPFFSLFHCFIPCFLIYYRITNNNIIIYLSKSNTERPREESISLDFYFLFPFSYLTLYLSVYILIYYFIIYSLDFSFSLSFYFIFLFFSFSFVFFLSFPSPDILHPITAGGRDVRFRCLIVLGLR